MAETIQDLKKKLELYEKDPEKRGYFALVKIVNQQIDHLNDFVIKDKVVGKASEDATYARTKDIWEGLPTMISKLSDLKSLLKITKADEEEVKRSQRITPESISDVLGNTAGQLS